MIIYRTQNKPLHLHHKSNSLKKKVTYIISNINKAIAFEWIAQELNKDKFELSFILLNPGSSLLEKELKSLGVKVYTIIYRSKKDMPRAFIKIFSLLMKIRPAIVHTHLFDASLIGLPAAYFSGIRKRIYTRHHATYHHNYYPKMIKYDKMINSFATAIVAISKNVEEILIEKENVRADKIHLIHHGFKLEEFEIADKNKMDALRNKYFIKDKSPVIGVIARYTHWKGIQYIIPAFEKLLSDYPDALLILANANGDYKLEINNLLKTIPPDNFVEINFEEDLFQMYHLFDVYVHTPIDSHSEAFGQTYVEALAAGVPSVFTLSGIAREFIKDKHNALVVDYKNSDEIYNSIKELLENKTLSESISKNGKEDVRKHFGLDKMIAKLEELYAR